MLGKFGKSFVLYLILNTICLLLPPSAEAHAFGQQYTLPLPAWLYIYGGGATVLLSFLLIGFFAKAKAGASSYPTINLSKFVFFSLLARKNTAATLKCISIALFILVIVAGFTGNQFDASQNLTTVF